MDAARNSRIVFPAGEYRVQSPYFYLQSVGSTSTDGSTYGAHVRWLLTGNLGETHLPKGDHAATRLNFNRPDDYMTLLRSPYVERFPTFVDFRLPPHVVHDASALWVYTGTNTGTVVYIHFRDAARYASVRAGVDPHLQPLEFVKQYCPGIIEAELPDKLFFAAELDIERSVATVMRAEALSVESNVPLSPLFVSCRRRFTNAAWCPPDPGSVRPRLSGDPGDDRDDDATSPAQRPCAGPNLLLGGDFEFLAATRFPFETDYQLQAGPGGGIINVVGNAQSVNPLWSGRPHAGESFLAVDGHPKAGADVLRSRLAVKPHTVYRFSGWLSTLYVGDVSIPLEFRCAVGDEVQTFPQSTPAQVNVWEPFTFFWTSGTADNVVVSIASASAELVGNDFGIDDLTFCEATGKECLARIRSENIRSLRFDVNDGYPLALEFETYEDYISGTGWELLGKLALTTDDGTALNRLEPTAGRVDGRWQKFNDGALVSTGNYQDRWWRPGGLKEGVQRYISLSDSDPKANASLPGAKPEDGSIPKFSVLDALQLVSLDFHVARMFGLGYLDLAIDSDTAEYVYLGMYDTEGALDDGKGLRPVRHYSMSVPTRPLDHRLPAAPILRPATYGLPIENGESQPPSLTDENGYTPDGQSRYVNVFVEPDAGGAAQTPFFVPPEEFCAIDHTASVFYGVEYRKQGEVVWRGPEIAHDESYKDAAGQFETLPLPNNPAATTPILRHEERENGIHEYGAYGINWFSRASHVGNIVATDATLIRKAARLLPPANFAVQLIQPESPPLLTTAAEQAMLASLSGDKTLVRVTFDYHHVHDVNYGFADTVELFFRTALPRNVVGALRSVTDDPADARQAVLRTTGYTVNSQGTIITPALAPSLFANFVGGILSCQQENYIIADVAASTVAGEGPLFTVDKNIKGNASDPTGTGVYLTVQDYVAPTLSATAQVVFMAVENMADAASWGTPNPLAATIALLPSSPQHQETYVQDGETVTLTLRGVSALAKVTAQGQGLYLIEFTTAFPHHPQHLDPDPVDWYKGVVRIAKAADPGPKKVLDVLIVEHIGDSQPLVLHALDEDPGDPVQTGASVMVNYYPGYRVYLHADAARDFDSATLQPTAGEGMRKTWLGARACDTAGPYSSPVGVPAAVAAVELVPAEPPGRPHGPEFATWPDAYYKSSYTFTIGFSHKPFAVALYRSNDEAILRALYKDDTYATVRQQLELLGEEDPHRADRWRDLLGLDFPDGTFAMLPAQDGYAFPNPDKGGDLNGSPPGSILAAVREAIWGAFTPLTEQPLIYDFIKDPPYMPLPKAQNIRNSQGILLSPADAEFDQAPMARKTKNGHEIQFTDFTLDGTGNNIFFYLGREIGNRGRLGDAGPIAGPVQLINTRPPDAPAIKRMYIREPSLFGLGPEVNFEVNAYPDVQRVRRMLLYRATDPANALSVRTMELVKSIDLEATGQLGKLAIFLADDFESGLVPYGDPLFYRIVALRKIKKPDGSTDWAPSQPSKALLTTMIDSLNPEAPDITVTSDGLSGSPATLANVVLSWPATVHNGTYYLDAMTSAGNWRTIYTVPTNDNVTIDLAATELGTNILPKTSDDGRPIYNRFRVRVENSSGLFNVTDRVLTI